MNSISETKPLITKLHLGCGQKFLPGYIHADIQDYDHIDIKCNVDDLSDFIKDKTISEIYACHVFEHFERKDVYRVLCEWNRVLKSGGILRISVPDFENCVQIYLKNKLSLHTQLLGLLYGGQKPHGYDYHYMTYDYDNLSKLLQHCGFGEVKRYDPHEFLPQNYDDYSKAYIPHMDPTGICMSLNLQCIKLNSPKPIDSYITSIIGRSN